MIAGAYVYGAGLDSESGVPYANGTCDFLGTGSKLFAVNKGSGAETVIGSHGISIGRQMCYGSAATLIGSFGPGVGGSDGALAFIPDPPAGAGLRTPGARGLAASPNPFRQGMTVSYTLDAAAYVQVDVHDIAGRRVATLFRGIQDPGDQRVTWRGNGRGFDAPADVYFVQLVVDREVKQTLKLVHLRS